MKPSQQKTCRGENLLVTLTVMARPKTNKKRIHIKVSPEWKDAVDAVKPDFIDFSAFVELITLHGIRWWNEAGNPVPPKHPAKPPRHAKPRHPK
jgi:hypothetical protein